MAFQDLMNKITKPEVATDQEEYEYEDDDDYLDDLLPEDPKPSWLDQEQTEGQTKKTSKTTAARAVIAVAKPKKFTKKERDEVKETLVFIMGMPTGMLAFRDPVCAGALDENLENIIDKLIPIIEKNTRLRSWFMNLDSASNYMDYLGLLMALTPVMMTVKEHHFTKDHNHEEEELDVTESFFSPV